MAQAYGLGIWEAEAEGPQLTACPGYRMSSGFPR